MTDRALPAVDPGAPGADRAGASLSARALHQRVSQFHENPRILDFAATRTGNVLLWATAALLLVRSRSLLVMVPLMILAQALPARRAWIMALGGIAWALHRQFLELGVHDARWVVVEGPLLVGALYLFYRVAGAFSRLPRVVRSHPQISLHLLLWCAIALGVLVPEWLGLAATGVPTAVGAAILAFTYSIWRIGFLLYSGKRGSMRRSGFADHLVYLLPAFGGSHIPYGKGYEYLASKRADSPPALRRSQLAGIKLLALAWLWSPVHLASVRLTHLLASAHAAPALGVAWAAVFAEMVESTLRLTIKGHLIIGCLRLFGFNVFRNTYKPLLATSLVAFWNRYFFYFKELLVEFFFYPIYLRFFKQRPRLRIFAATMAAACIGNWYHHALERTIWASTHMDSLRSAPRLDSYLFYAFLLGIGVFVSMLREQNRRGKAVVPRSPAMARLVALRKIAGVWLFFALIRIWDHPDHSFWENTARFLALFGIPFHPGSLHG
jgi:hypothetical protein